MTIPPCFSFLKKISRFPWPLRQGALLFAFTAFVILPGTAEPKKELQNLKRSCRRSSRFTRRKSPLACCKGKTFPCTILMHCSRNFLQGLPS
ncbi:putative uncharacterized protein [Acidaminococcus intestini CAG:325]|nr:putative uncharacterized protein [Acidaminococcus intestini CAG:325]